MHKTINIPKDLHKLLKQLALDTDLPLNKVINSMLLEGLKSLQK